MRPWLLVSALLAVTPPADADQIDAGAPTVLHLTQSAERRIIRDLLHVDMRAEGRGADPKTVEAGINRGMAKALAEAKQASGIEASTSGYNVYRDNASSEWIGSQSLLLSGADSGALLALAGTLQTDGLVMSNLDYAVAPATVRGAENILTAEALAGLGQRAAAIAQQLHVSVLGYRDVTVGNAENSTGPMPRLAATAASSSMPASVAAAGEGTVRVTGHRRRVARSGRNREPAPAAVTPAARHLRPRRRRTVRLPRSPRPPSRAAAAGSVCARRTCLTPERRQALLAELVALGRDYGAIVGIHDDIDVPRSSPERRRRASARRQRPAAAWRASACPMR